MTALKKAKKSKNDKRDKIIGHHTNEAKSNFDMSTFTIELLFAA